MASHLAIVPVGIHAGDKRLYRTPFRQVTNQRFRPDDAYSQRYAGAPRLL